MNDAIKLAKSLGGKLEKRRAQTAKTRAGGQQLPASRYMPEVPRQVREEGGKVEPEINNPMSVFPKPQRMFGPDEFVAGGQYLSMPDKQDMTGHKSAAASIGVKEGGKPYFTASKDAVDETGTSGRGSAIAKTNLFKQKAGWKWQDAPEGHEDTNTIVSVEHRGKHFYALNAHFPKGVDFARYENSPSEPRLRPTTRGNVELGPQAGTILVRGREHPVYHHVIVKNGGGSVDGDTVDDGITAYHGSPHDFDQFDFSKMGTGQGQQIRGAGGYFSADEPFAKTYSDDLVKSKNIENFTKHRRSKSEEPFVPQMKGHMYEVHIDAHPDHFLDWDKPLSEQSDHVRDAFDFHKDLVHSNPYLETFFNNVSDGKSTGAQIYKELSDKNAVGLGEKGASDFLHSMGIHGVRYLDAGSRNAEGKGTRNYVVFDDKRVNVKRKYEQGGSVHGDDFIPHDDPQRQANLDAFDPIRDENGAPRVFYHGTKRFLARPTPDIQAFKTSSEMGAHFGNQAQAHDTQFVGEDPEDEGQIYPVHLSIKNPIRLRDLGRFTASNVASQLRDMGHDIPKDIGSLDIQNYLKSIGHDGVVYLNRREGLKNWKSGMQSPMHFNSRPDEDFKKAYPEAEDSYIAFDANQAKSAIGNKGTFDKSHPHLNENRGGAVGYGDGGGVPEDENNVVNLAPVREQKQLSNFHKDFQQSVKDRVSNIRQAGMKLSDAGAFDGFNVGDRFMGSTGEPMKIENLFARKFNPRYHGSDFESRGISPTLIEHEGEYYLPMATVLRGVEGENTGDWSRGDAYVDFMRHFGYKKMGIQRKEFGGAVGYKEGGVIPHDDMQRDSNLGKFLQGSKVRNGQGDHVVLYHITPKNFDQFKAGGDDPELSGPAIWLSPNKDYLPAAHNVQKRGGEYVEGTNVMPVYANIKSPLVLDNRTMIDWARNAYNAGGEFPMYIHPNVKQALINDGYDGIFWGGNNPVEYGTNDVGVGEQPHGEEEVIAFHPHQIKSATGNNGNFDPKKPSINEARGGSIGYADGGETQDYVEQQRAAPTRAAFREKIARQNEQENPMLANFYKQTEPFGGREIMSPLSGTPMGIQPRSHDQFLNMMNVEREKRSEMPAHEARANAPTPVKEPSYMDELAFALEGVKRHGASFLEDLHRYANEDLKKRMQEYSETLPTAEENVRYLKEKAGNALSAVGDFIAPPAYAHGGNVSHRPHYGFGGEGEGPIAGATGSASGNSYGGGSDQGSSSDSNYGGNEQSSNDQSSFGGNNGGDRFNSISARAGDTPGFNTGTWNGTGGQIGEPTNQFGGGGGYGEHPEPKDPQANNSLFSNPFNKNMPNLSQNVNDLNQNIMTANDWYNTPFVGNMFVKPAIESQIGAIQPATERQQQQIANVMNIANDPNSGYVPSDFATQAQLARDYQLGAMPLAHPGQTSDAYLSAGPSASIGRQDYTPPTPSADTTSTGQTSIRSDFNNAFAAAARNGQQTFDWVNPATGQKSTYRVAYKTGGRALYPTQVVEHVLNKIGAPPPALDPRMVATRGRP